MKPFFVVALFFAALFLGVLSHAENGGRGGDPMSRLVNKARNIVVPDILDQVSGNNSKLATRFPEVAKVYALERSHIMKNLGNTDLIPVDTELYDDLVNPSILTWIETKPFPGAPISYSRHEEVFKNIVKEEPNISNVTEFFLHELGHQYGQKYGWNEDSAWTFAQALMRAYGPITDIDKAYSALRRKRFEAMSPPQVPRFECSANCHLYSIHHTYSGTYNVGAFGNGNTLNDAYMSMLKDCQGEAIAHQAAKPGSEYGATPTIAPLAETPEGSGWDQVEARSNTPGICFDNHLGQFVSGNAKPQLSENKCRVTYINNQGILHVGYYLVNSRGEKLTPLSDDFMSYPTETKQLIEKYNQLGQCD